MNFITTAKTKSFSGLITPWLADWVADGYHPVIRGDSGWVSTVLPQRPTRPLFFYSATQRPLGATALSTPFFGPRELRTFEGFAADRLGWFLPFPSRGAEWPGPSGLAAGPHGRPPRAGGRAPSGAGRRAEPGRKNPWARPDERPAQGTPRDDTPPDPALRDIIPPRRGNPVGHPRDPLTGKTGGNYAGRTPGVAREPRTGTRAVHGAARSGAESS